MDLDRCAHCSVEIEDEGIEFKNLRFCCDACCEEFEDELLANGEPAPEELEQATLVGVDLDELEFAEEDDFEEDLAEDLEDDFTEDDDF